MNCRSHIPLSDYLDLSGRLVAGARDLLPNDQAPRIVHQIESLQKWALLGKVQVKYAFLIPVASALAEMLFDVALLTFCQIPPAIAIANHSCRVQLDFLIVQRGRTQHFVLRQSEQR